jgi:hypothetical protein
LINGAYRGESSKAGWTTEAFMLGERTNEEELTEILLDSTNTLLKFTEKDQIFGLCLLLQKKNYTLACLPYHLNFKMVVLVPNYWLKLIYMQNNWVF